MAAPAAAQGVCFGARPVGVEVGLGPSYGYRDPWWGRHYAYHDGWWGDSTYRDGRVV